MSPMFRLGLFVLIGLSVLFAGVFLIGRQEAMFQHTYRINAQFRNVAGLGSGAEVRVGGLHEGSVKYIQLPRTPDGQMTVVMDVDNTTRDVIKQDSIASIKSEGLIGDKYMEISFGSNNAGRLKSGDTIASEPPLDLSNLAKKADGLLDSANGAVSELGAAGSDLKSISAKIDQGKGTVGALINDKTIYEKANAGATALNEDMEALKHNFLLRGFFKNRGYEDAADVNKNAIAALPPGDPVKTFNYDGQKLFNQQAKLKDAKALQEAGGYLQANSFKVAVVVASTGMKGDSASDRVLSEGRATAIRKYLADNFRLDDTRIKTLGLGKTDNTGDNGNAEILVYSATGTSAR